MVRAGGDSGSLERYLETFDHTVAVMQTADNLRRVAREFVEDLAADGVVYGETRWAPEQHRRRPHPGRGGRGRPGRLGRGDGGLPGARSRDRGPSAAHRDAANRPTPEIAELAMRYRGEGVAGFDIAGPEGGFPPTRYLDAFHLLRGTTRSTPSTPARPPAASRSGRRCRCAARTGSVTASDHRRHHHDERGREVLGDLAAYVRDQQIPLEMCPSSNVQTGAAASIAEHPIGRLDSIGFRVTVNSDNQLMSGTTLSREFALLCEAFDYTLDDVRWFTINAAKSVFAPYEARKALVQRIAAAD